jgi:hypothetical protein
MKGGVSDSSKADRNASRYTRSSSGGSWSSRPTETGRNAWVNRRVRPLPVRTVRTRSSPTASSVAWLQLLRHQPEREHIVGWLRVVARHEAYRLLRGAAREPLTEDLRRSGGTGDRPEQAIPLAERIADPRTVELTVEAREALRSLAALRWRRRRAFVLQAGRLQLHGDRREARCDLHKREPPHH